MEIQKKKSISASLTTLKPLTVCHYNCRKFLERQIADNLTCHLRSLHVGQEATVRMEHGTTGSISQY